jgi:large subunit ribosomal protein L18|tara:strand:- start:362 stop:739 length:378 start_codon:yes stop_codon:yes gene_type:complete
MAEKKNTKRVNWLKKRARVKGSLTIKKDEGLRLVVFRSNKHIYGQVIDDGKSATLISSSSNDKSLATIISKTKSKIEKSKIVGKDLGEKLASKKIKKIVFDRNGYKYHGRVKALADSIREAGIKI